MKVGLALSGGGARGFAHIGALRVLVEAGAPIDLVAGTSVGSFAGGAFAAGMSPAEMVAMSSRVRWRNSARPSLSTLGLLSNAPMGNLIRQEFPVLSFDQTVVPFGALACDLQNGTEVLLTSGELDLAIRASCAVPGIFAPVKIADGRLLVDGGVMQPVPVKAVRQMGADVVIAIDLMACGGAFHNRPRTAIGVVFQAAMTLLRTASISQHYSADVVIAPEIAHLRPDDLRHREECTRLGAEAAERALPSIEKVIAQYEQSEVDLTSR